MAIIVLPGGHRLLGETDRNEASIRLRAGLPAGATLDQPNSSFANALLRLVHLGGDLADGNSVYPNVPKGLSRASQPVTSLIRGDPPSRWNTTDLALMLEFELIEWPVVTPDDNLRPGQWKDRAIWGYSCDGLEELVGVNGLAECDAGTFFLCRSEQLRAFTGNGNDRHIGKQRFQLHAELQPIDVRHLEIVDDDLDAVFQK